MAVRSALGAGRGPLIRLSLVESAVLAILGSLLGLVVMRWVVARARAACTRDTAATERSQPRSTRARVHRCALYRNGSALWFGAGARGVTLRFVGHAQRSQAVQVQRVARQRRIFSALVDRAVRACGRSAGCRRPSRAKLCAVDERRSRISRGGCPDAGDEPAGHGVPAGAERPCLLHAAR